MNKLFLTLIAVIALVLCAPSIKVEGQPAADPVIAPAPRTINLTQEQRFTIKEIVKDLNIPSEPADAPETIGDKVPADITLHAMPDLVAQKVPQAKSHTFFLKNSKIVLVSPSDRRVADVIK